MIVTYYYDTSILCWVLCWVRGRRAATSTYKTGKTFSVQNIPVKFEVVDNNNFIIAFACYVLLLLRCSPSWLPTRRIPLTMDTSSVVSDDLTEDSDTAVYTDSWNPENELLLSVAVGSIAKQCISQGVFSTDDARFQYIIERYESKCPGLTHGMVQRRIQELARRANKTEVETSSALHSSDDDKEEDGSDDHDEINPSPPGRPSFKSKLNENGGFNLVTFTILQLFFAISMFIISVVITHSSYNRVPYRNWALAGGVTSTSAEFRVRGPEDNDNVRREFVVSANSNLGLKKDQILNVPVSYTDFLDEEHFVKRLRLDSLKPMTTYYYAIVKPQILPNSVTVVDDNIGSFKTPETELTRMNFTVALGSCSLTGSRSQMFQSILDLEPQLFIHLGDFHYEDLVTLDVEKRLETYDKVMGSLTQRNLYMGTIFTYIWDDHDWLANNDDGSNVDAGNVAKQGYSIGIPHYKLGSIETNNSTDEGTAAKYQAFTIGTVRFIILDLRSESRKSTASFGGRVYSDEQKQWLFNELSQADDYDYVVLASSRPWTGPEKVGSDSWGGFVSDRNELSSFIASTVGAGPKNLIMISGDNHMIAFDDGSSTDHSGQSDFPGGMPLLHSGPLSKFGPGGVKNIFKPKDYHFTEGCMAVSTEINYQFSTIEFTFPQDAAEDGCMRIRGYRKDSSSDNIIFEKEVCGEIMRIGTPEQDTCQMKSFTISTTVILLAALALVTAYGILAMYFLGRKRIILALGYFCIGLLFYGVTIAASLMGALCFGMKNVNTFAVSITLLCQTFVGFVFVSMAVTRYCPFQGNTVPEKRLATNQEEVASSPTNNAKESHSSPVKYDFRPLEGNYVEVQPSNSQEIEIIL